MACRCATVPPASIAFFLILFFSPPFPSPPLVRSQVTHSLGPLSTLLSASSSLPDLSLFSSSSSRARSAVSPCLRPSAGRGSLSLSLSICLSRSPGSRRDPLRRHGSPLPAPLRALSFQLRFAALVATGRLIYDQLIWIN